MLIEYKKLWPTQGHQIAGLIEETDEEEGVLTFTEFLPHAFLFCQLRNHLKNC